MVDALSPAMTLRDFENGYWHVDQLKDFATRIGIPAANKLQKDELEMAIVEFLRTGNATKRSLRKTGPKGVDHGLSLKLRIGNYTSNRERRTSSSTSVTALKEVEVPKDYASWLKARATRKRKR